MNSIRDICKYNTRHELCTAINKYAKYPDGEKLNNIISIINQNQHLISDPTAEGAEPLREKLIEISEKARIKLSQMRKNNQSAASIRAYYEPALFILSTAMGIFRTNQIYANWETFPQDLTKRIFFMSFGNTLSEKVQVWSLSQLAQISKYFQKIFVPIRDEIIDKKNISLQAAFEKLPQAIDYVKRTNLKKVNLYDYINLKNDDLFKMSQCCQELDILTIRSKEVTEFPKNLRVKKLDLTCQNLGTLPDDFVELVLNYCQQPIVIPKTATSVESLEFYDCDKSINIPANLTKLKNIIFHNCLNADVDVAPFSLDQLIVTKCKNFSKPSDTNKIKKFYMA